MSTNEHDRLDLRQAFEKMFADDRMARLLMEALPPIDYSQLATKQDVAALRSELKGDLARLDATIDSKAAESLRFTVLTALTTTVLLGGYITAVLG